MSRQNVLFLCTGNSCRSQMAEALLRKRGGDRYQAFSAGAQPNQIHPLTIRVLQEKGLDTSPLRSKNINELVGAMPIHHLIVVCGNAEASCPSSFPGMLDRQFWPFDDPPAFQGTDEQRLAKFREVRDQIDGRIQKWLADK